MIGIRTPSWKISVVRPEMLPGAVVLLALGIWRTHSRGLPLVLGLSAFAVIVLLPLAHNLYYGHTFAIFTSSPNLQRNFEFTPAQALANPRATIGRHVAALLDLNTTGNRILDIVIHVGQLLWVGGVALSLSRLRSGSRSGWRALAVLALPFAFAIPFVVVQVEVYYPRHIIATYLMIWPALMVAAQILFPAEAIPRFDIGWLRSRLSRSRAASEVAP